MMNWFLLLLLSHPFVRGLPPEGPTLVTVTVKESRIEVGKMAPIPIWVEVARGYHIQAHKVNDESLIPTTLEVNSVEGVTVNKQEFPPGKQFKLEGTDTSLDVYDGKFLIQLFLSLGAEMQERNYTLGAKLHYQACDSKSCLFPRVIDFSIPIEVKTKESK